MTRLGWLVVTVCIVVCVVCAGAAWDTWRVAAQGLPGRQSTPAPERYPVEIVIRWSDGSETLLAVQTPVLATATPVPTDPATATSSPTQTLTPSASPTASPTASSTPGATETLFPTPTPQTTLPPVTVTVQPPVDGCNLTGIALPNLNVRSSPVVSPTNRIGVLYPRASYHEVLEAVFVDVMTNGVITRTDEWNRIVYTKEPYTEGLVAAFYAGVWLIEYTDEGACSEVRFPEINKMGIHASFGANIQAVINAPFGVVKGADGAETLVKDVRAFEPNTLIIWRNLCRIVWGCGDGPPGWGTGNPVTLANLQYDYDKATWQERGLIGIVDYFEITNELSFAGDWEVQFWLQLLKRATADGICLAVFSDGYGNPLIEEWSHRRAVFEDMARAECQPGKRHIISLHSYSYYGSGIWLFERWKWFRAVAGPEFAMLQFVFTEFGVPNTVGDYGGRGQPDCGRAVTELAVVNMLFAQRPEILGYAIFGAGGWGWLDFTECMPLL